MTTSVIGTGGPPQYRGTSKLGVYRGDSRHGGGTNPQNAMHQLYGEPTRLDRS